MRFSRVYYGWWIVLGGFILQGVTGGVFGQAFGAYFVHLQAEFGWSRTVLSGAFSLGQIEGGIMGPVQGWLLDRLGPRTLVRIGIAFFALGLVLLSWSGSVPTFYGAFLIATVGAGLAGYLTINTTLVNWFVRRRATAMALAATGWGVAGLLIPGVAWALETFGWRETARYSGLLVFAVGIPAAQLMRRTPEEHGYRPDGDPVPARDPIRPPSQAVAGGDIWGPSGGFTLDQALRTQAFWLLAAGHGSALLVVSAVIVHLIPHLVQQAGLSLPTAAAVLSLLTILSIVGQLLGGFIGDRMDKRRIAAVCMVCHMLALLGLAVATALPVIIGLAALHGIAWGLRGPLMAAIRADYFGRRAFGVIMGLSSLFVTIGAVAGPLFAGFMADLLGDYRIGFIVLSVLAGLGSVFFLAARRSTVEQQGNRAPLLTRS